MPPSNPRYLFASELDGLDAEQTTAQLYIIVDRLLTRACQAECDATNRINSANHEIEQTVTKRCADAFRRADEAGRNQARVAGRLETAEHECERLLRRLRAVQSELRVARDDLAKEKAAHRSTRTALYAFRRAS